MRTSLLTLAALIFSGLMVAAPDESDSALQDLKDAASKNDAAQVKKLALQVFELTNTNTPAPAPETEIDKDRVNHAREVRTQAEFALYSTAVQSEPATELDLFATLEQLNPKSKYLDDSYVYYFQALTQTGAAAKIPGIAEKALKNLPSSPDLLGALADLAAQKNQNERAVSYAQRLIAALGKRDKSEIMPQADWQKKKTALLGHAHLISGVVYNTQTRYYYADKELRAALPLLKGDDAQTATALFYLGLANYQLGSTGMNKGQVLDAVKFSRQCAAIKGPLQDQAAHNAQAMKNYADGMR